MSAATNNLPEAFGAASPPDKPLLIAHGVWGTLAKLPEPALLFTARGFEVLALNAAAQRFFGNAVVSRVKLSVEASLTKLLVERLCLAGRGTGESYIHELPAQLTLPDNSQAAVRLTVMPLAVQEGPRLAVLYIRRLPQEQLQSEAYAKLPRELLSWMPIPAWLVDEAGNVPFQNPHCPDLPFTAQIASARVKLKDLLTDEPDPMLDSVDDEFAKALVATADEARRGQCMVDRIVTHSGEIWRVAHIPVQGVDRKSYLLGLGLRMSRDVSGAIPEDEEQLVVPTDRRRRLQIRERERERMKLAREVHDSLGQELTVLRLGMDRLFDIFRADLDMEPKHMEQFALLKEQMQQVISSSRQIAFQLRTDLLQSAGLLSAIDTLVAQFRQRLGIAGQLEVGQGWEDPKSTLAGNIYRSVQELLSNMAKHARANQFIVRLAMTAEQYQLTVVDDGVGIPREKRKGHLGLHTMRERVEYHNGEMRIQTRPEVGGTSVTLTFMREAADNPETVF